MPTNRPDTPPNSENHDTPSPAPSWAPWSDDQLLDLRFCDLGLRIAGTRIADRVAQLYEELDRRGIRFRPHVWLSSEWFSPDGVPGIAIPFYLAHPRLMRLEDRQMLEVEGGTREWCMRILRHETGHSLDTAYRLRRRRRWRELFGHATSPYPDFYSPKPYSKQHVLHLDWWYAQSHPTEDFAETFAVWLTPNSLWWRRYRGWPAMKKLEYVDELMHEIAGAKPIVTSHAQIEPLPKLRKTLRKHYQERLARYENDYPDFYDRDLRRLFPDTARSRKGKSAAAFLRRIRPELRKAVASWTGQHPYCIDQVLQDMIARCRALRLRVGQPESQTKLQASILLTAQTMNYLYRGRFRIAL